MDWGRRIVANRFAAVGRPATLRPWWKIHPVARSPCRSGRRSLHGSPEISGWCPISSPPAPGCPWSQQSACALLPAHKLLRRSICEASRYMRRYRLPRFGSAENSASWDGAQEGKTPVFQGWSPAYARLQQTEGRLHLPVSDRCQLRGMLRTNALPKSSRGRGLPQKSLRLCKQKAPE